MGTDSPFARLGIPEDADTDAVRHAFRVLARRTHPDLGGDRDDFEAVRAAYVAALAEASRRALATRCARGRDPYRRELADLEAAARLLVPMRRVPPTPTRGHPVRPVRLVAGQRLDEEPSPSPSPSPSAVAFAAVLAAVQGAVERPVAA